MSIFIPNKPKLAKKYFCFNLFNNKLVIGLWGIPDSYCLKLPRFTTFNFSAYSKFGIRWKKLLFEVVWNKRDYSFDSSF